MTLKTKINLTPSSNYQSIGLLDITGTGVTGYGSNQDPVGKRKATSSGNDIYWTRILITSPSQTVTTIDLAATAAFNLVTKGYTLLNTALGYNTNDELEDGIWKVEYIPFLKSSITGSKVLFNGANIGSSTYNQDLVNNTWELIIDEFASTYYCKIQSIDLSTHMITFTSNVFNNSTGTLDLWYNGIGTTLYVPIAKGIKEHLDNKVADIPAKIGTKDSSGLAAKYLLYDAMFINCEKGNGAKAQQIFDLLTIYSNNGY